MKSLVLSAIIALTAVGLYAQTEPEIKLELVWEKEIPKGVRDFVFLDEDGYNVFSSQCKDPERALKAKRILMVADGRLRYYEGDEMKMVKEVPLRGGHITISKNGRNIVTIEGLELDPSGKGGFVDKPAILRLYNWKGEELARGGISPGGWDYINLYPLGNDKAIAMSKISEGTSYQISMFVEDGGVLREVFTVEGQYPTGTLDYAENGSAVFFLQTRWDAPIEYEERKKPVERIVIDGAGEEVVRYNYRHPGWAGWVSPKGNFLVEVTRGKYLVIRTRDGELIAEHHVQGQGNYYAAFSPDEKYLCVTPGPWRVYFFETKTGKMLWEYVDMDEYTHFSSLTVLPSLSLVFAGRSEALLKPGEFKGTVEELNKKVIANETKDRTLFIIENGKLLQRLGPFLGKGFGTQLQAPVLKISNDEKFLFVLTPSRLYLYKISIGGE